MVPEVHGYAPDRGEKKSGRIRYCGAIRAFFGQAVDGRVPSRMENFRVPTFWQGRRLTGL